MSSRSQAQDFSFEVWFCSLSLREQIMFRLFGVLKFSELIQKKLKAITS
jgi:hypothetical protein